MRNILTVDTSSHYNTLGSEASDQRSSCGGGPSTSDELCSPEERSDNCTYECNLLHDPPAGYNNSCEFIQENCDGEYELLNYLQFVECILGPNLRVSVS